MCEKKRATKAVFEPKNFDPMGNRSQIQLFQEKKYAVSSQTDLLEEVEDNRPVLHISFSGGRTSGVMTEILIKKYNKTHRIIVTFANTGRELEETLQFVHDCDVHKGFNTVWLEGVFNPEKGKGTRHKIVSFETATRGSAIFTKMIEKYGIPNKSFRHCTRELKINVMNSYLRSLGLKRSMVQTAIGIRADEPTRSKNLMYDENYCFPLLDANEAPMSKQEVIEWWSKQSFDLQLEEHDGNCALCFEKSDEKVIRQIIERPDSINFILEMEAKHAQTNNKPNYPNRVFFRGNASGKDMLEAARLEKLEKGSGIKFLKESRKTNKVVRDDQALLAKKLEHDALSEVA